MARVQETPPLSPTQRKALRKLAGGARLLAGRSRRDSVLFDDLEPSRRTTLQRLLALGLVARTRENRAGSGPEYEISDLGREVAGSLPDTSVC